MNCEKCGHQLAADASFCSRCGTPLRVEPRPGGEQVSDVLDGKWRLDRKIGEGGMGTVYLAHDLVLDRKVAIKLLSAALTHDAELVGRFEREAKLTAGLEHPNIVPVFSVGRAGPRPFMVMKFLEGMALSSFLRSRGTLQREEALSLTRQVAAGLDFIHSRGFIHRDIKTGNIFVSPSGHATILDFGILRPSRGGEAITRTGMVMGTPQYMAPEQALGVRDLDHRVDLYALAVVIFECLTGRPPFEADNDLKLVQMQAHAAPPDVRTLAPWLPPAVSEVMARALAKNPEHRFGTASELTAALETAFGVRFLTGPTGLPELRPLTPPTAAEYEGVVPYPIPLGAAPVPARGSGPKLQPPAVPPGGEAGPKPSSAAVTRASGSKAASSGAPVDLQPELGDGAGARGSGSKPQPPAQERDTDVSGAVVVDGTREELLFIPAQRPARSRGAWVAASVLVVALAGVTGAVLLSGGTPPGTEVAVTPADTGTGTGTGAVVAEAADASGDAESLAATEEPATDVELAGTTEEVEAAVAMDTGHDDADAGEAEEVETTAVEPTGSTQTPRRTVRRSARSSLGKLNVITTFKGGPYWASILINGKRHGTTPALLELPPGRHKVRVERTGFRPVEKQIKVASGGSAVLRIELIP